MNVFSPKRWSTSIDQTQGQSHTTYQERYKTTAKPNDDCQMMDLIGC